MTSTSLSRRLVLAGTAAAALLPMRTVLAQTAAAGGDWLAMIQAHHALVAATFDKLLASGDRTYMAREQLVKLLGYQLTAHSVAEENAIYPALALSGMITESDKLYLDQAHAKVVNAQLEMQAKAKGGNDWMESARALQVAVLRHAKEDEEGRLYPQLRSKLNAATNAMLATKYQREFDSVKPIKALEG